jgi:hypothetical protein
VEEIPSRLVHNKTQVEIDGFRSPKYCVQHAVQRMFPSPLTYHKGYHPPPATRNFFLHLVMQTKGHLMKTFAHNEGLLGSNTLVRYVSLDPPKFCGVDFFFLWRADETS